VNAKIGIILNLLSARNYVANVCVMVVALISWIARPGFQMMLGANFLDGAAVDEVVSK
jgi:hypothetical protein